jgi:hypothetical protein
MSMEEDKVIVISPQIRLWLEACQNEVDDDSKAYIQHFINETKAFTRRWYYAMPVRPYFVDGQLAEPPSIIRPSIEEELASMSSGFQGIPSEWSEVETPEITPDSFDGDELGKLMVTLSAPHPTLTQEQMRLIYDMACYIMTHRSPITSLDQIDEETKELYRRGDPSFSH